YAQLRSTCTARELQLSDAPTEVEIEAALSNLSDRVRQYVARAINSSAKLDLLRARRDFSTGRPRPVPVMQFRPYLRIASTELRHAVTRLLLSEHSLSVERLRWRDGRPYDIPREARLCRFCRTAVEEPLHCLFHCRSSQDLCTARKAFWSSLTRKLPSHWSLPDLRNLDVEDLFHLLLSVPTTADILAALCARVMNIYETHPRFIPSLDDIADLSEDS
ncbi:hypothetical protein EXIGLDRAFT_605912, partial [Exidia glandulosa HHB12029]